MKRRSLGLSGLSIAVLVFGIGFGTMPVGALVPVSDTGNSGSPSVDSQAVAPPTGCVRDLQSAVRPDTWGGYEVDFTPPGSSSVIVTRMPPHSFNPENASVAELNWYGFGNKPVDVAQHAQWLSRATGPFHQPLFCSATNDLAGTTGKLLTAKDNPLYSGVAGTTPEGNQFSNVTGTFNQTGFRLGTCPAAATAASWVGLGGIDPNSPLLQAGTIVLSTDSTKTIFPFWEAIGPNQNPPQLDYGFHVTPGDAIQAIVNYDPVTLVAHFQERDPSRGYNSLVANYYAPNNFGGTTGEFVDERTTDLSGHPYNLLHWFLGTVSWTDAEVTTYGNQVTSQAGTVPHEPLRMDGNNWNANTNPNDILATIYGDMDTNRTFTDHWQGCSDQGVG